MTVFHNSNGKDFEVMATLEFVGADKEYLPEKKYRAMLLHDYNKDEYIVANYVEENSWGSGYYADNLADATRKFNSTVESYLA